MKRFTLLLIALLFLVTPAFGYTSANLLPQSKFTALDSNGDPYVGGKLYTYETGTTTLKTTWTDSTKVTANTNPVILDSRGQADVWIDASSTAYRLRLLDADGTTVWTVDDVRGTGVPITNFAATLLDDATATEAMSTLTGAANTYYVDASEADQGAAGSGRSLKDIIDAVGTSQSATIVFAHSGSGNTTTYTVGTSETVPSNFDLKFDRGAILSISSGATFSIAGDVSADPFQIFSLVGTGVVSFSNEEDIYADWFDNTSDTAIQDAIDSLSATYGGRVIISSNMNFSSIVLKEAVIIEGIGSKSINITHTGAGVGILLGASGSRPVRSGIKNIRVTANSSTTYLIHIAGAERCVFSEFVLYGTNTANQVGVYLEAFASGGIYYNTFEKFEMLFFDIGIHTESNDTDDTGQVNSNFFHDFHIKTSHTGVNDIGILWQNGCDNFIQGGDIEGQLYGGVEYGEGFKIESSGTAAACKRNRFEFRCEVKNVASCALQTTVSKSQYNYIWLSRADGIIDYNELGGSLFVLDAEAEHGIRLNDRVLQKGIDTNTATKVYQTTTSDKDPITQPYFLQDARGNHAWQDGAGNTMVSTGVPADQKTLKISNGNLHLSNQTLTLGASITCNFDSGQVASLSIGAATDPTIIISAYGTGTTYYSCATGTIVLYNGSGGNRTITIALAAGSGQVLWYPVATSITMATSKKRILKFISTSTGWEWISDSGDLTASAAF